MSDPLRTETSRTPEPASKAEREAKIEQLLLAGLDHYFGGHYDQAINVWTRALFLDRSHAPGSGRIERARSAQAERLRESEALLHDGAAAATPAATPSRPAGCWNPPCPWARCPTMYTSC